MASGSSGLVDIGKSLDIKHVCRGPGKPQWKLETKDATTRSKPRQTILQSSLGGPHVAGQWYDGLGGEEASTERPHQRDVTMNKKSPRRRKTIKRVQAETSKTGMPYEHGEVESMRSLDQHLQGNREPRSFESGAKVDANKQYDNSNKSKYMVGGERIEIE